MADHPNAATWRAALEALATGDVGPMAATFSDDLVWHAPGNNPHAGTYTGKEETMARLGQMMQEGVSVAFDVHDVVGNDEHVVALVDATFSRGDTSATGRQIQILHVDGEMVSEYWAMNEDQAAVDRVMSG